MTANKGKNNLIKTKITNSLPENIVRIGVGAIAEDDLDLRRLKAYSQTAFTAG